MKLNGQSQGCVFAVATLSIFAAHAQGTFQNLDFEGVRNVPVFNPTEHPWSMSAADALPFWNVTIGAIPSEIILYNDVALDSASVGVIDRFSSLAPAGLVAGNYGVSLQSGFGSAGQNTAASISQDGIIPGNARSIRFRGYAGPKVSSDNFALTFNGAAIPLQIISDQASLGVYAGDISRLAGSFGELRITSSVHFSYLDEVVFSPLAVPEPSVLTILTGGAVLHLLRIRRGK